MAITPLEHGVDKKCNVGATIAGIDLKNIPNEELEALRDATHRYQLVIIKGQHEPDPVKQWQLLTRLDPTTPQVHGHGTVRSVKAQVRCSLQVFYSYSLSNRTYSDQKLIVHGIPAAPNIRLIGKHPVAAKELPP